MSLKDLLSSRKKDILKKWQERIFQSYPAGSKRFLTSETDKFANPVGYSIKEKAENLFDELVNEDGFNPVRVGPILDNIIRIRAIQDFSPSEAVSFIYLLKDAITDELEGLPEPGRNMLFDIISFYNKIDRAAMTAFELYMKCREKLFEIKVEGAKNQISGLLRRSDLIVEIPERESAENNVQSD
ncbi:RsbRD N-terminal domain-containing protein [Thermodesulfobacteriota bacterium]